MCVCCPIWGLFFAFDCLVWILHNSSSPSYWFLLHQTSQFSWFWFWFCFFSFFFFAVAFQLHFMYWLDYPPFQLTFIRTFTFDFGLNHMLVVWILKIKVFFSVSCSRCLLKKTETTQTTLFQYKSFTLIWRRRISFFYGRHKFLFFFFFSKHFMSRTWGEKNHKNSI